MPARVQMERPHQGVHTFDGASLRLYGFEQGERIDNALLSSHQRCADDVACCLVVKQDRPRTVAEALQAAVASLLAHGDMKYKDSFYYWAGFTSHGFGDVLLDDSLLDEIHARLGTLQQEVTSGGCSDCKAMEQAMKALTQDAYHRVEDMEQALLRECCEKWRSTSDGKAAAE